jgi:hypothetical protein
METIIMVEECEHWKEISSIKGQTCTNCAHRDGWTLRGQPDEDCVNFEFKKTNKFGMCIECQRFPVKQLK